MTDYGVLCGIDEPGCLVDSSRHNIDGTYVCGSESILAGKFVFLSEIVDGYKVITDITTDRINAIGVSVMSDSCHCSDYMEYEEGDPVSVATMGRVWVLSEDIVSAPEYEADVYVTYDGFASGEVGHKVDGWFFTGDFVKYDQRFNLVGVNLLPGAVR